VKAENSENIMAAKESGGYRNIQLKSNGIWRKKAAAAYRRKWRIRRGVSWRRNQRIMWQARSASA